MTSGNTTPIREYFSDWARDGARALPLLESVDIADLSFEDRFLFITALKEHIYEQARQNGHWKADRDSTQFIDEKYYAREIAAIRALQDSMGFSPSVEIWLAERRTAFIRALRKEKYSAAADTWPRMKDREKLAYMDRIAALLFESFGEPGLRFENVPVWLDPDSDKNCAYTYHGSGLRRLAESRASILIGRTLLLGSLHTLHSLYHECLHGILHQVAIAAQFREIDPRHPLFKDSQTILAWKKLNPLREGPIRSVYRNDPEEKAVFAEEFAFADDMNRPTLSGLWQIACRRGRTRLRAAAAKIIPGMDHAPAPGS